MRVRPLVVFGSLLITALSPGIARADDAHAPPMLTPQVAADVAVACPEARPYADALVRGITLAEAAAARPPLTRCANATRLPYLQWKNSLAAVGLAAVELSAGTLTRNPALFKSAADATRFLRDQSSANDAEVRAWDQIPDAFDITTRQGVVFAGTACVGDVYENAAYLNVAARSETAWIVEPRAVPATCVARPIRALAGVPLPLVPLPLAQGSTFPTGDAAITAPPIVNARAGNPPPTPPR